jgi:Ca-activated chloride channel family protein
MAVDASLSTKKDLKLELISARKFAHEIMRPQDALALYQFSEIVEELVPFTSDLKRIDAGIERVHVRSATAMYDAIYLGSEALYKRAGRKVMVIITDGGDTMSSTSYQEALRAAQQSEATVYSVIVVPIEASAGRELGGEHALIQLSHDTGGKYYYADTLPRLERAFEQISDELRAQYLLAYYPVRRIADSDFRKIKIDLKGPATESLRARHRTGYFTSKFK